MFANSTAAVREVRGLDFGSLLALPGSDSEAQVSNLGSVTLDDRQIRVQTGAKLRAAYNYVCTVFSEGSKPMVLKAGSFNIKAISVNYHAVNPALYLPVVNMFAGGNMALEGEPGTGKTTVVDLLAAACFNLSKKFTHRARVNGNPNATEEKLNATFHLGKLVKDGIKKVIASFFSLSLLKIIDEDNRFPSEILSLLYTILAEGFVTYQGFEIKFPKGPIFAARNFADSGNFELTRAYRDRFDAVVPAMGINPAELDRLLISGNGDIAHNLKLFGAAALIDDLGLKYADYFEVAAIELVPEKTLKEEIAVRKSEHNETYGEEMPPEVRNQMVEDLVTKYAPDTIGLDVVRVCALEKFNEWLDKESKYREMQGAIRQTPWSKEAKRLLIEFAGQTKYCFGIAPDKLHEQVREFFGSPESIYDLCATCPINDDKLTCKRISFVDGKGLGTRWLQSVILYVPYVSAYLGHEEIGAEELMQIIAAVLHDRAEYHENNMRIACGGGDAKMRSYQRRKENAFLDMLKDARALVNKDEVAKLYDELFAIEDKYRHMQHNLHNIQALSKRIATLLSKMFKKDGEHIKPLILKSASSTAVANHLENMLSNLLNQIDSDERRLLLAELSAPSRC